MPWKGDKGMGELQSSRNEMTRTQLLKRKWNFWADWDMGIEADDRKMKLSGVHFQKCISWKPVSLTCCMKKWFQGYPTGRKAAYSISYSEIHGIPQHFKYSDKFCRKELYLTLFNPALFKLFNYGIFLLLFISNVTEQVLWARESSWSKEAYNESTRELTS